VIPTELDQIYPLSQYEIATPFDIETINYVAKQVANYITTMNYEQIILLQDVETWKGKITTACKEACEKKKILLTLMQNKKTTKQNPKTTLT